MKSFPIEVLHTEMQTIVKNISDQSQASINTIAANMLVAAGFSFEHKYQVQVNKSSWVERSNLWLLNVAKSGKSKTHILNGFVEEITNKDNELQIKYKHELSQYNLYKDALKSGVLKGVKEPEEHLKWCLDNLGNGLTPPEPRILNTYVESFTFEAFDKIMSVDFNDGRPVLIKDDEFSGFVRTFNQYRKGADEQNFLKFNGYNPRKVTRTNGDACLVVKEYNVSVIGSTQFTGLHDILTDGRKENGFAYRFLYCIDNEVVDITDKTQGIFHKIQNSPSIDPYKHFNDMVKYFMLDYESTVNREFLYINDQCFNFVKDWEYDTINRKVSTEFDTWEKIIAKAKGNIFRIAIIINRINAYFNHTIDNLNMRIEDFEAAAKILDYFFDNTVEVLEMTDIKKNRFFKSIDEQDYYNDMSENITHGDIVKGYMKVLKQSEKTAKRAIYKWVENKIIAKNSKSLYYKI